MEEKPKEQPSWGRIGLTFLKALAWLFFEAVGPVLVVIVVIILLFVRCN